MKDEEDLVCIFLCELDFALECLQWHKLTLPFPIQCYMAGTHSRCLRVWEWHLGEMDKYFHKVKGRGFVALK